MRWIKFLAGFALLALSVVLPIQPAFAEGDVPSGTIPAAPPVVHRVIYRVNNDGSREVIGLEKKTVATSAYIVPAPPPDAVKPIAPLKGSDVTTSVKGARVKPLVLGEGYYNHYAYYNIASASVKQTTYFYQDSAGSQTIYWTKYESQNGVGFGIVWFRFRNMANSQVCCSWQVNQWAPYTQTTNTYVNSQGSGTRLENYLDDNTNWWADYYIEFVVGI
jgi:hypothetical protein